MGRKDPLNPHPRSVNVKLLRWSDVMKIMKDTEGRERLKREGIRLIQDRTRRQTETMRTLRAQGKVGYYRGGQLQVKDKDSVPPGQYELEQRWHNSEHQAGSGRVMGGGSQGGQNGRRGRGGGQGGAWTRRGVWGGECEQGGKWGGGRGEVRRGAWVQQKGGGRWGRSGMEEGSESEGRNEEGEENVRARGERRRVEMRGYGGGTSVSERQRQGDIDDSGSEMENIREYDQRAKEKGVQEEEGVEDRLCEYDGKNNEEKAEKDGVNESNKMRVSANVSMSERESLPQSIWEFTELEKGKGSQRLEGEISVQSIAIDRTHSQGDLVLEPAACSQCEPEDTNEQLLQHVAVTLTGESEGAVLIEGVQDSFRDTTTRTQGTHSDRGTVRGKGDEGGRKGEGVSPSDETHTKLNMRQTSLKDIIHTRSNRKAEEEREREDRMRDVAEGIRAQTIKKQALRSNANNTLTPNRQPEKAHANTHKKVKKSTK